MDWVFGLDGGDWEDERLVGREEKGEMEWNSV